MLGHKAGGTWYGLIITAVNYPETDEAGHTIGLEYQYQILVFTGRQYLLRMWFTQNYVNSDWGVWPTLLKERVLPPPGHPPLQGTTLNEHSLPGMLKNPFCPGHLSSLHSGPGNECPPVAQL